MSDTTHVARSTIRTDRSVLEVDVVRLEVDVSEQRLEGCAGWPGTYQGRVEGRRHEEDCRLGVIHACLNELVVPDMHQVAGGGVALRIIDCLGVELTLIILQCQQMNKSSRNIS